MSNLIDDIKTLHLQKGDVLVLGPRAARWFSMLPPAAMDEFVKNIGFEIPVIIGDATKLSRDDLVRMLENMPA